MVSFTITEKGYSLVDKDEKFVLPVLEDFNNDPNSISFSWSMIDKITPRPDEGVKNMLIKSGFSDVEPIITTKNTYVASFTNAEEAEYLLVVDANGAVRATLKNYL